MTAVANPPSFPNFNQPSWGVDGGQTLNNMNPDELRGMFPPRKPIQRSNSSSSISSSSSASSTGTLTSAPPQTNGNSMPPTADMNGWPNAPTPRKRPQPKAQWSASKPESSSAELVRMLAGRPPAPNGGNPPSMHHQQPSSLAAAQGQMIPQNGLPRQGIEIVSPNGQPVLYLLSLNGTFERKTIAVPFYPDTLRIGRQTNAKTVPTPINGFFDSKVLSRQHAEVWAERNGKIWIRDVKSSNGTFVNGTRLSPENRESEPHELQVQDHVELGIDIVSEDQKTVVHHKVAAKVEHAGFASPSSNLVEMNLSEMDPSAALLAGGPVRARASSQTAPTNNRMPAAPGMMAGAGGAGGQPNGLAHQRQLYFNPVTTENIVKRLHNEMRNARLQNQDLNRTGQFISSLLSKDDVKNQEKAEASYEPPKHPIINGGALSFRSDGGKTRFSEPPAPPPSQPLPEKPDVARQHGPDVPGLKRGVTERPKSHPPNASPSLRQENGNNNHNNHNNHNMSQILQLTEALNTARKEIDSHSARVRELEEMFQKEREARLQAEDMVHKMEETSSTTINGSATSTLPNGHPELDRDFDPSSEKVSSVAPDKTSPPSPAPPSQPDRVKAAAAVFQAQIDSMVTEMKGLREQLDSYRQRAEKAETERDTNKRSLAELVMQIQKRDEEEKRSAERKSRSTSKSRSRPRRSRSSARQKESRKAAALPNGKPTEGRVQPRPSAHEDSADVPTLSRANTITPSTSGLDKAAHEQAMIHGLPYASMIGVVLIGMGLMAYINGWQAQPRLGR